MVYSNLPLQPFCSVRVPMPDTNPYDRVPEGTLIAFLPNGMAEVLLVGDDKSIKIDAASLERRPAEMVSCRICGFSCAGSPVGHMLDIHHRHLAAIRSTLRHDELVHHF